MNSKYENLNISASTDQIFFKFVQQILGNYIGQQTGKQDWPVQDAWITGQERKVSNTGEYGLPA